MIHFLFNKDIKEFNKVEPQNCVWVAVYNDGTFFKQYDDNGMFHLTNEIDTSKLKELITTNGEQGYKMIFDPKIMEKPYFEVTTTVSNAGTTEQQMERLYKMGYIGKDNNTKIEFEVVSNG